jgi:outer membrane receptor protein involved in Fe transport
MLPQDVLDNTVKAFGVSASSLTGYGPLGPPDPNGRYIAPANSLDCIEVAPGYGDCGANSVVVTGPTYVRFDFSVAKQVPIKGRVNFEFRAEMLNAFNKTNFTPVVGVSTDANPNVTSGDSFEVITGESGRTIQLVFRINF